MPTRLLLAASILLLGFAAVPNAVAADVEIRDLGLLECQTYSFDAQGDGTPEPWTTCSTPTCGCDCPYAGAGVVVEAADQQTGVAAVTSGCQTAYSTNHSEADGGPVATVWPVVGGGGLDSTA